MSRRARLFVIAAATLGLVVVAAALPPIPQPPAYHDFADQSVCFGVPHCLDTLSNLGFIAAGLWGLVFLASGGRRAFADPRERLPYRLFFAAMVGVGLASGWYHLAPDNDRLVWDRAAIGLALMAWFAAVLGERTDPGRVLRWLPLLLAAGAGSAFWWHLTESLGRGDLRPYLLMQALPMVVVPLLLYLYPPRYAGDRDIVIVLCLYPLALAFDLLDKPVAAVLGVVGGHTLKHLIAAAAAAWVVVGLRRRLPGGRA